MLTPETRALEVAGRYADLLRSSLESLNRAAIEGRPDQEALAAVGASRACRRIGRSPDVLTHAARAAALARTAALPGLAALATHAHAGGLRCARRYDEALAALREALDAAPAEGHDVLRAEILLDTAEAALEAGARPAGDDVLGRGEEIARRLRDPHLLAWSLYLRSQLQLAPPAELPLAAAYELARRARCPELQWQILWRLSERAEALRAQHVRDDLTWTAVAVLSQLAETLEPDDSTAFWRLGPRRVFLDQIQRRYGPTFLQKVMMGGGVAPADPAVLLAEGLGLDPAAVAPYLA